MAKKSQVRIAASLAKKAQPTPKANQGPLGPTERALIAQGIPTILGLPGQIRLNEQGRAAPTRPVPFVPPDAKKRGKRG
jgi:hypothetical protein